MADPDAIMIATGGDLSTAPVGSTMPTTPTEVLDVAFAAQGYVSSDGATWRAGPGDAEPVRVWQSKLPVKYRAGTDQVAQLSLGLAEFSRITLPFAMGGGEIVDISGDGSSGYRFDPADPDTLEERALVLDWTYQGFAWRLAIPRIMVSGQVESTFVWSQETTLPITCNVLETPGVKPYSLMTMHPAFAP